jgi:hypothetical protein
MRTLPIALLLSSAACAADATSAPPAALRPVPEALAEAHEAYLADDMLTMTRSLRSVLEADAVDADVRENALALLDAAYTHARGSLPADWSLPRGLDKLEIGQVRVEEPNLVRFTVWLSLTVDDPADLTGLVLRRGDDVLLDLAAGRGRLKSERQKEGRYYLSLEGDEGAETAPPGVYEVRIAMRDQAVVSGWVIVGDNVAATAPRITAPARGVRVDANPTLSFEDWRSPAFRPFEERLLWVGVSRAAHLEWSINVARPDFTEVVVGQDGRGQPETKLAPGRHWVAVQFTEVRRFGPMRVARAARTQGPFDVR